MAPAAAAAVLGAALLSQPRVAFADADDDDEVEPKVRAKFERLSRTRTGYGRITVGAAVGRGLRFNNPYRLRTQLGETGESLSLTATYFDTAVAMSFGDPDSIQHGGVLHMSFALEGIPQQAISASYLLSYVRWRPLLVRGWLGPSLLTSPTTNLGAELGAGATIMLTGVWGLTADLVGSLYYGAGTEAAGYTVYPILSGQLGVAADFEVLP
jgi:hypothetical protein